MTKTEILEALKELQKNKTELEEKAKLFIKDKSKPLDDRWELFVMLELGQSEFYFQPKVIGDTCLYDDFGINRYQTYDVDYLHTVCLENEYFEEGSEKERLFKEQCLEEGVYTFIHDW